MQHESVWERDKQGGASCISLQTKSALNRKKTVHAHYEGSLRETNVQQQSMHTGGREGLYTLGRRKPWDRQDFIFIAKQLESLD